MTCKGKNIVLLCASAGGTGVHAFLFCSGFGLYLSRLKKPLGYEKAVSLLQK